MRKRGRGSIHCSGEVGVGLLIARDVTFLTKRARGYIYILLNYPVADPGFWNGWCRRRRHIPRSGASRGVWGHAPHENFDILDALRWILEVFSISR